MEMTFSALECEYFPEALFETDFGCSLMYVKPGSQFDLSLDTACPDR
jgi:hypothetical protein